MALFTAMLLSPAWAPPRPGIAAMTASFISLSEGSARAGAPISTKAGMTHAVQHKPGFRFDTFAVRKIEVPCHPTCCPPPLADCRACGSGSRRALSPAAQRSLLMQRCNNSVRKRAKSVSDSRGMSCAIARYVHALSHSTSTPALRIMPIVSEVN